MLSDLLNEVDGRLGVVMIVDAQDAKSGRFINIRELIKALMRSSYTWNKLHIQLH